MTQLTHPNGHHANYRSVTHRLYISGYLTLLSPAHFGSGQVRGDALVDMSLLIDAEANIPLIPGTTIAGALRSYLRSRLYGYNGKELSVDDKQSEIARLFGPTRESGEDLSDFQSLLIVDDGLSTNATTTLRDGVRIDPTSNTAYVDKKSGGAKFDVELLQPGTKFLLNFEVLLTKEMGARSVLPALVVALEGLENGAINLGLRKRRGYGQCTVDGWSIRQYELGKPKQLCEWLQSSTVIEPDVQALRPIRSLLTDFNLSTEPTLPDHRSHFDVRATFSLKGSSLLIRSGFGEADNGPDMVHLHSIDEHGNRVPVIPGTSWAGVLRHRALRIVNTIKRESQTEQEIVETMFGSMPKQGQKVGTASRLIVDETPVRNGQILYQTRVRIDRFTGGALETALFEQAPVYGAGDTEVEFHIRLLDPQPHEKGLLMLLLKDLWTRDLPVGGEASVGRGRLSGLHATITERNDATQEITFVLSQKSNQLGVDEGQRKKLQGYVDALWQEVNSETESTYV